MSFTVGQIAEALGAQVVGEASLACARVSEPSSAGADDLAIAMDPKFAAGLADGAARAAVLWDGADWQGFGLTAAILVTRPRYAMAGITAYLDEGPAIAPGVHDTAIINPGAQIGKGSAIGPFVVVGSGARIGMDARIASHCSIGAGATIGAGALLLDGVKIGERVTIGDRFVAQPGAVIGADGFSFVTPEKSTVESARESMGEDVAVTAQSWARIHSLGSVVIGDDVEVGANSAIDRGTIADTVIGSGTKIDNLVQIGHNVQIGNDCLLCGQSGVAGSARLGDRVVVGGAASVADHLKIGNDAVIAGKSGVASNVPAGQAVMGYPAMPMERNVEAYKALRRLPRLMAQVAELRKAMTSDK